MNVYQVLMTMTDYVEVKANSPEEASMKAYKDYRAGALMFTHSNPEFVCEEADLIEGDV